MASLIDNVISLEEEADGIIEAAQTRSKSILSSVDDELKRYREELTAQLEARLAEFRAETEKRFEDALARISMQHSEKLRAVKELPEEFSRLQVDRILDRFNNW